MSDDPVERRLSTTVMGPAAGGTGPFASSAMAPDRLNVTLGLPTIVFDVAALAPSTGTGAQGFSLEIQCGPASFFMDVGWPWAAVEMAGTKADIISVGNASNSQVIVVFAQEWMTMSVHVSVRLRVSVFGMGVSMDLSFSIQIERALDAKVAGGGEIRWKASIAMHGSMSMWVLRRKFATSWSTSWSIISPYGPPLIPVPPAILPLPGPFDQAV